MIMQPRQAFSLVFCLLCFGAASAQPAMPTRSPEQLAQLLGPIALYPDALVALILPAATDPSDVTLAARYLQDTNNDFTHLDDQPWDDSLKALAHYPDVVKWMDQNLAWTQQVGAAFVEQPADVMNAVQRLRAEARANGVLVDTPQQQIVDDDGAISIIPAQADVIYVPYYDPDAVYLPQAGPYGPSYLAFGPGYATGFWLGYDVDWGHRRIWTINPAERERYWRDRRDWRRPVFPGKTGYVRDQDRHPWRPQPDYQRPPSQASNPPRPVVIRPTPFPTPPGYTAPVRRDRSTDDRSRAPVAEPSPRRTSPGDDRDDRNSRSRQPQRENSTPSQSERNGPPSGARSVPPPQQQVRQPQPTPQPRPEPRPESQDDRRRDNDPDKPK